MENITAQFAGTYAHFLVELFPRRAIEVLRDEEIFQQRVVQENIRKACEDLANGNLTEIKALIEGRNWPRLREIEAELAAQRSPESSRSRPTDLRSNTSGQSNSNRVALDYTRGRVLPSSSDSVASESQASNHGPSGLSGGEKIIVYHEDLEVKLSVRSSNTTYCLIGRSYLNKFPGLTRCRIPEKNIPIGGRIVKTRTFAKLEWTRPTAGSSTWSDFYIVSSNDISGAQALLGSQQDDGTDDNVLPGISPIADEPRMPEVPEPPVRQMFPSSSINPTLEEDLLHHNRPDRTMRGGSSVLRGAPTSSPMADTMDSHTPNSSHGMERLGVIRESSPGSPQSNRSRTSSSDNVMAWLKFERSSGKKLIKLNLNETPNNILKELGMAVNRIRRNAQIDHQRHQMKITPMKAGHNEPTQYELDPAEFDEYWRVAVEFINSNRDLNRNVQFTIQIWEPED